MNYEEIKKHASVFVSAAKCLEAVAVIGLNKSEDEKMGAFFANMIIPSFIIGAFSCELILRSLAIQEQKETTDIFRIDDLYQTLNRSVQNKIASNVINKVKMQNKNYSKKEFIEDLTHMANIFADWRLFLQSIHTFNNAFYDAFFETLIGFTLDPGLK